MPPASRKQPSRQLAPQPSQPTASSSRQTDALTDFQARRVQRRLDDLERTNPTDIPASSFVPEASSSRPSLPSSPASQSHLLQQQQKKKQSANVRRILYGKKSLKDWLDELPPNPIPPYLFAVVPPPRHHQDPSARHAATLARTNVLDVQNGAVIGFAWRRTNGMEDVGLVDNGPEELSARTPTPWASGANGKGKD